MCSPCWNLPKTESFAALFAVAVLAMAAAGCDAERASLAGEAPAEAAPAPVAESEVVVSETPPDPTLAADQQVLETLRSEMGARLGTLAQERAARLALRQLLNQGSGLPLTTWRREVLFELYGETDYAPMFVSSTGQPSPFAEPLLLALRAGDEHALDTSRYHLAEIAELEPRAAEQEALEQTEWPWNDQIRESLLELTLHTRLADEDERLDRILRRAVGLGGDLTVRQLEAAFEDRVESLRPASASTMRLELLLVDALLSYARDMRLANVGRMSDAELLEAGGASQVVADRLRELFRFVAGAQLADFEAYLTDLIPTYPQYAPLMASLARYREIVAQGGWDEISARDLRRGSTHARVRQLKQRLSIEGYYDGPIDNQYDEPLEAAVRAYQETHQMDVTGRPHTMFWRSLNIPAEERLRQIEVTLARWRESRIADDDYYVHVNVPDFHAEVWRGGERISRFRVVTGNNQRECDPDTNRMELVNATPLISAEIEYIVFNPYWNVPLRIRQDELDLELIENPAWLQENGYEVVVAEGASPRVRQLPGPDNALGAVKFIFPNSHNIYMHDTPRQQYFQYPIRAYSHGCIRVHEPVRFAELLLSQDAGWEPARIEQILEAGTERTVHLDQPVPIHVEYYVVRIDDEGRTNFLSDIYRYDRLRMGDASARGEECEPEIVEEAERVAWSDDGTAVTPDGTIIHPDGEIIWSETQVAGLDGQGEVGDTGTEEGGEPAGGQPEEGDYGP